MLFLFFNFSFRTFSNNVFDLIFTFSQRICSWNSWTSSTKRGKKLATKITIDWQPCFVSFEFDWCSHSFFLLLLLRTRTHTLHSSNSKIALFFHIILSNMFFFSFFVFLALTGRCAFGAVVNSCFLCRMKNVIVLITYVHVSGEK